MVQFLKDYPTYFDWLTQQCRALKVPSVNGVQGKASYRLSQTIAGEIEKTGAIPFSQFMHQALYEPGLGYYSAGSHKLGEGGDFVTAPELSPLFAQTLAKSFIKVFAQSEAAVLELGAGSGAFAVELMKELEAQNQLPHKYAILEVSADLKQRQRQVIEQAIPHLVDRFEWLDRLPSQFAGVIFANEVADALPVDLVRKQKEEAQKAQVKLDDSGFRLSWQDAGSILEINPYIRQWPHGYTTEHHLQTEFWLAELVESLTKGALILIDYGYSADEYYAPQRAQGTLQCYYRQHKHNDPLMLPGLQDITASVNFSQLAYTAHKLGAEIIGYCEQALFLMSSGIERQAAKLAETLGSDTMAQVKISQQLKKLLMPDEMGENCKVLIAAKNCPVQLKGFALSNKLHRL